MAGAGLDAVDQAELECRCGIEVEVTADCDDGDLVVDGLLGDAKGAHRTSLPHARRGGCGHPRPDARHPGHIVGGVARVSRTLGEWTLVGTTSGPPDGRLGINRRWPRPHVMTTPAERTLVIG